MSPYLQALLFLFAWAALGGVVCAAFALSRLGERIERLERAAGVHEGSDGE